MFINDLDDRSEYTLSEFGDDTKLGEVVDRSEDCAPIQMDLNNLEKWANRDLMNFNKRRCQILHLGRKNARHQYTLGTKWMESTFEEKELWVLVNKMNVNQHCVPVAKAANSLLDCITKNIANQQQAEGNDPSFLW